MTEINAGMRHQGWRRPTYDPELASRLGDSVSGLRDREDTGSDPVQGDFIHHVTYLGEFGESWPGVRELLRDADEYGYRCVCLVHDGWGGEDECSLDEFDSPPEVAQVYETADLIELVWL